MDADLKAGIDALYKRLEPLLEKERTLKRLINEMSMEGGESAPFPDVDADTGAAGLGNIAPDQFYGKPLVTSVREILRAKKRAMLGREIYDILKKGNYQFEGKDENVRYRGFTITLSKRTEAFHKIPGTDSFGLVEWYPEIKKRRERNQPEETTNEESTLTEAEA